MRCMIILLVAVCALIVSSVSAGTWVVLPDGTGDAPTIQAGIDSASAGDTVMVMAGTYHEHDIAVKSGIYLTSETGTADCVSIRASQLGRVLMCDFADSSTYIVGFTLAEGRIYSNCGGGMWCWQSSPRVINCRFEYNYAEYSGGAAELRSSSPVFTNCVFSKNTCNEPGYAGGGVKAGSGSPIFDGCVFSENESLIGYGGGLSCEGSCKATLTGCIFAGNVAGDPCDKGSGAAIRNGAVAGMTGCTFVANNSGWGGSAVFCENLATVTLDNCIIAFSESAQALYWDGSGPEPVLTCCDLYGNAEGDWVGAIADQYGVNGNFSTDPRFCNLPGGDFSLDGGSPCVNAPGCGFIGALGVGCDFAGIGNEDDPRSSAAFCLYPNVPNPFTSCTVIGFMLPKPAEVVLTVHDVSGRQIALLTRCRAEGEFTAEWDRRDESGREVRPGIYFVRIKADQLTATRKMVVR